LGKTARESLTDPVFEEQDSSRESWGQCDDLGSVALSSGAFWFCYRVRISNTDRAPSACYSARKILSASSGAQPLERQRVLTTPQQGRSAMDFIYALAITFAGAILFLAVDRYENDTMVANLLKFLVLIFTSVAILHRLQPFGIAWF
jgi:hypothetical protein